MTDLISRLRRTVLGIDLDARNREALARAFDRFAELERRREIRSAIATARAQKRQIALLLGLLAELDELTDQERDHSAFVEAAVLFKAIAGCAGDGAAALLRIESNAPARNRGEVVAKPQCCSICRLGGAG